MEWINVKDELPKDGERVFVKGHFCFEVLCEFIKTVLGYFFIYVPKNKEFFISRIGVYGVTHFKRVFDKDIHLS